MSDRMVLAPGSQALQAVAVQSERLIALAHELRAGTEFLGVDTGVDCRALLSGSSLGLYLEATPSTGDRLAWWVEVTWDEIWRIESKVSVQGKYGQDILEEFPERTAVDIGGFVEALVEVIDVVVNSARSIDLSLIEKRTS